MNSSDNVYRRHRAFKLLFVPLLIFSLVTQLAVVWTQLDDIRNGYFDFVLYYSGARILHDGNGSQLYNLEVQREYQKKFAVHRDSALPFNHLPYELLTLVWVAKFPFPVAHVLWTAMNVLLLAILLFRVFPFLESRHRSLLALMAFAYFPTMTAIKMGQDSIITTLLLGEIFVSLKHKRYALAGAGLALGLYKPQFFLPLAGILVLHRRWPAIFGFLFMGLLLGTISLAMVGWNGLMGLLSLWLPMINRGHVVWPELMMNLRGLVYVSLDLVGLSQATNVLTLVISLFVYVLTLRSWPRDAVEESESFDLRFGLAVVATALISFHLYSYDGTMLTLPLMIMLNRIVKNPGPYLLRHRVFLAILIASFLPLVPNVLLSAAVLAWWALPLPVLFGVLAIEISRGSESTSLPIRS
jgi:hypothetical protein